MEADFSGYATVYDVPCSDGRTISKGAFDSYDKKRLPLVWQHFHDSPMNVLGHVDLEAREDGIYVKGYFNDTDGAIETKKLVKHGDINALSIFANQLVQKGGRVLSGALREVSLVLSGANPGAVIDNVSLQHSDGSVSDSQDEAVIYSGLCLEHADTEEGATVAEDTTNTDTDDEKTSEETVQDILDTLTPKQASVVYGLLGEALGVSEDDSDDTEDTTSETDTSGTADATVDKNQDETKQHSSEEVKNPNTSAEDDSKEDSKDDSKDDNLAHSAKGTDNIMTHNIFEQNGEDTKASKGYTLSHSQMNEIFSDALKTGAKSLKETILAHAGNYGIDNIDVLFPDARSLTTSPDFISRRMEWVENVLSNTKHSPFSRIKTTQADITANEARAKGYVTGNLKTEEVFSLLKRTTTPTTIYKKQKLDRDDIVDITDFDVVVWLKGEMRLLLDEEIARAILVGDGRSASSDDKIKDPAGANDGAGIRSIANDSELYAHPIVLDTNASVEDQIEAVIRGRSYYKGSGTPTYYTTEGNLTDMLLQKDKIGRRLYDSMDALAAELRVKEIVPVEVMESYPTIFGILVNLTDYTIGADKGGEVNMFDDFDIDYNQQKYLIETRISGALTKPKSAVVFKRNAGTSVTPTSPSFNGSTNTITFPTIAGVEYSVDGVVKTGTLVITKDTEVLAHATSGYYIPSGTTSNWTFTYSAA